MVLLCSKDGPSIWNTKMDLFLIYCDLYIMIYGQNTFSAVTLD